MMHNRYNERGDGTLTQPAAVPADEASGSGKTTQAEPAAADDAAARLGARAYAQGSDLHFAPGQYAPGTRLGVHDIQCGPGGATQKVYCHNKIAPLLKAAFDQIVADGHGGHLHHFAGCYNDRAVGGADKRSAHAWGIAFDLNPEGNGRVKRTTPEDKIPVSDSQKLIAPYFEAQGFVWGKAFGDSMHFQYCTGY